MITNMNKVLFVFLLVTVFSTGFSKPVEKKIRLNKNQDISKNIFSDIDYTNKISYDSNLLINDDDFVPELPEDLEKDSDSEESKPEESEPEEPEPEEPKSEEPEPEEPKSEEPEPEEPKSKEPEPEEPEPEEPKSKEPEPEKHEPEESEPEEPKSKELEPEEPEPEEKKPKTKEDDLNPNEKKKLRYLERRRKELESTLENLRINKKYIQARMVETYIQVLDGIIDKIYKHDKDQKSYDNFIKKVKDLFNRFRKP